jgi:hypothetical protein
MREYKVSNKNIRLSQIMVVMSRNLRRNQTYVADNKEYHISNRSL